MTRGRKPEGDRAMSGAERMRRLRARAKGAELPPLPREEPEAAIRAPEPPKRRERAVAKDDALF